MDGDQVVGDGQQDEGEGEDAGGGNASAKGECEAEKADDGEEGEVEGAAGFVVPGLVGGVRDTGPEEVDAAGDVGGEVGGVGGDEGLGECVALGDVAHLAEGGIEAKLLGGLEGVVV